MIKLNLIQNLSNLCLCSLRCGNIFSHLHTENKVLNPSRDLNVRVRVLICGCSPDKAAFQGVLSNAPKRRVF
jgi:hypothetical protein